MSGSSMKVIFDYREAERKQEFDESQIARAASIANLEQQIVDLKRINKEIYQPKTFELHNFETKFGDSDSESEYFENMDDTERKAKQTENEKFNASYDRFPRNYDYCMMIKCLEKQNIFKSSISKGYEYRYYENAIVGEYSDAKDSFSFIDRDHNTVYFDFSDHTKRRMLKSWIKRDFHLVADEFEQEVTRLGKIAESSFASNRTSLADHGK